MILVFNSGKHIHSMSFIGLNQKFLHPYILLFFNTLRQIKKGQTMPKTD